MVQLSTVLNYLAKLALCLIILIGLEGMATLGYAYDVANYNWAGYTLQICFVVICLRIASKKWE